MTRRQFTTGEVAEMLLQLVDGKVGGILVDDTEYIGQGIHKFYFDRDTLHAYSGRGAEES